jgi:hypothetical protein
MVQPGVGSCQEVRKALARNRSKVVGMENKFETFHPLIYIKQDNRKHHVSSP